MMVLYSNIDLNERVSGNKHIDDESVYFEYAPIVEGQPGPLTPLSDEVSGVLARALGVNAVSKVGGFLIPNVLFSAFNGIKPVVAWYTEPQKRRLLTSTSISAKPLNVHTPWLLWIYKDYTVYIFATKEKPTRYSKLHHAPFHNIYNDGRVCMGSGSKLVSGDMHSFEEIISKAELAFFGTIFNHQHNDGIKGNLVTLLKKLDGKNLPFPNKVLKPANKKLSELLNVKIDDQTEMDNEELLPDEDDEE
jgi:PRTRC genetic system protein B